MSLPRAPLALFSLLLSLFLIPECPRAQQTAGPSTQGAQLLRQSLSALVGNTTVTDVTLSGTARRIAGSDDETGTATLLAMADGHSRMDLNFPSGPRSWVYTLGPNGPAENWSGPDSVVHSVALHNVWTTHSWFFPAFTVASFLNSQNSSVVYVGQEKRDGQAVIHIVASQQYPDLSGKTASLMQHLTETDIFLDATTLLPLSIAFNTHPNNNALLDIPVEIRFSNYRPVSGIQSPFRIQKFINNALALNLEIQSVSINSGLSAANFTVTAGQ